MNNKEGYYDTPGYLMMGMRYMSSEVTRHVKTTKDKFGQIQFTLAIVSTGFSHNGAMLVKHMKRADTFAEYVVKKADFTKDMNLPRTWKR